MRSPTHNVGSWLTRRAEMDGEHLAILDDERSLDYAALHDRAIRCTGLLAGAGVGRGDRVALILGNRSAYLEAVFAAARLGAIAVPLNARLTARELGGLLADCRPALVLEEVELGPTLDRALEDTPVRPQRLVCGGDRDPYERALTEAAPLAEIAAVSPDDPMILMYTSGTTGVPKGALLPHRKTLYNSLNAELFFGLGRSDRVLVSLPLFHSFGLSILSIPALYAGAAVILQRRFEPEAMWEAVSRHGITYFGGVPSMFQRLLDALEAAPPGRFRLDSLRFLFTAGAAIPVDLIRAFERRGLVLKQGFGQTETSILCCLDACDAVRRAGSVGRPVFHAEVVIVRPDSLERPPEQWEEAAVGERGEIVVRGPITMLGYWNRPDATAQTLRGDWLRTGDLATRDADGFLTLVGRSRDLYISGGENVYPAEIEGVYGEHPDVREIAVVGVPDPEWGEVGRAYVVPQPGRMVDPEGLREWARERLAGFKLPREFVSVAALPRTESGKVQKHRLTESIAGARPDAPRRSSKP